MDVVEGRVGGHCYTGGVFAVTEQLLMLVLPLLFQFQPFRSVPLLLPPLLRPHTLASRVAVAVDVAVCSRYRYRYKCCW